MIKHLALLLALFSTTSLKAAESPAKLQYLSGIPIKHDCDVNCVIKELQPGLNMNSEIKQKIEFLTVVSSDHPEIAILQPPVNVTFTLKNLSVNLITNRMTKTFDTRASSPSIKMNQLSQLVDKPIALYFGKRFAMENSKELEEVLKKLPSLRELRSEFLLAQLFEPAFALAGKNLTVGAKFQRKNSFEKDNPLPPLLNYQVTEINEHSITAHFDGKMEQKHLVLPLPIKLNDRYEKVEVTLTGTERGEIVWSRQNALFYNLKAHLLYSALLKIGEFDWVINIDLEQVLTSHKL